jgi:L-ascorbate metabolism protein UlaG (beta-lactamase superfamily)
MVGHAEAALLLLVIVATGCNPSTGKGPAPQAGTTSPAVAPAPSASAAPLATDVLVTSVGPVAIVPIHHATFVLKLPSLVVYVDPTPEGTYDGTKADVILVTHAHPDHASPKTVSALRKTDTVVVVPSTAADGMGDVVVMNNGDTKEIRGILVQAVPAYNLSRGPSAGKLYHAKGWGNGYVLTIGGKRIYIAGDTECTDEMRALQNIDVAFVPMNLPYTMPPSEAIACLEAFKPRVVYPYHFRGSDAAEVTKAFGPTSGVEVRLRSWY